MKFSLNNIVKFYINQRGWKTERKIVVIESDDWGSVRMPSRSTYKKLSKNNLKLLEDSYCKYDSIASKTDLENLFEVLLSNKDRKGNHPIITANTIVANPDFDKIKISNFSKYEFETFDKTIKKLSDGEQILKLWEEGITNKIFNPQLHGREHLHVQLWLEELKLGNKDLLAAFDERCFGIPYSPKVTNKRKNVMAALDFANLNGEREFQEKYIQDATKIFKEYFGYISKSFIASSYIWHPNIENVLRKEGVEFLQGLAVQYIPNLKKDKFNKRLHFTGQKNNLGQYYLIRNSFFEPTVYPNINIVDITLKKIETAFKFKKPAIIGSHRINFIGSIIKDNRDSNLILMELLIKKILTHWPDVEFMTSDQLGDLIKTN